MGEVVLVLNDIFLDRLPKIDLHGFDRDSARVAVNDFIAESFIMGILEVVIVHGKGDGIVKNAVHDALLRNKKVSRYHLSVDNIGCTIVYIKKNDEL